MESLIFLLAFPIFWPFVAKLIWKHELTLTEIGINLFIGVSISTAGWYIGHYAQTRDTEVLNGSLTSKERQRVSCEHSYQCNCSERCTGSGTSKSCSTECDTCYEHNNDFDWVLHSNVGDVKVQRINAQGNLEPARYTAAAIGDPFAVTSPFTNYIKAAPSSLFNASVSRHAEDVPEYPLNVRDYHYIDRVLGVKVVIPDQSKWNLMLSNALKSLGPQKQSNVVVLISGHADETFADAVNARWLGGKKNDVIVILGTPKYPDISWVRVLSWTDQQLFKVQLRDALFSLKTAEPDQVITTISQHISKGFVRKPMKDFEYLKHEVELPGWVWFILISLSIAASVGTSVLLAKNQNRYRF